METFLQAEERAAGAAFAVSDGCTLPESFAGFLEEYRAARDSAAIFDTSWHATYVLKGQDHVRFLNAVVSNNIQALGEGRGAAALLLNPQGRILAEFSGFPIASWFALMRLSARARERHSKNTSSWTTSSLKIFPIR